MRFYTHKYLNVVVFYTYVFGCCSLATVAHVVTSDCCSLVGILGRAS